MKRLAIFLITIFTMFSCEDFYKDNGCIEMYEGNTEASCTVYFYNNSTNWDNVYVYSWGSNSSGKDQPMFYDGDGWYFATVRFPATEKWPWVIFHSKPTSEGWGEQTRDDYLHIDSPYFTPWYISYDNDNGKIECVYNSYKYTSTLPTYNVYFYKGELDWGSPQIEYGNYGRGRKTMTNLYDGWYYAETIYPNVRFRSNDGIITSWVNCDYYTYFVPNANTLAVSEYSSKPDL